MKKVFACIILSSASLVAMEVQLSENLYRPSGNYDHMKLTGIEGFNKFSKALHFNDNLIRMIGKGLFKDCTVEVVNFDGNPIETIEPHAFDGLTTSHLWLWKLPLKIIQPYTFAGLSVRHLSLGNHIHSIMPGAFRDMQNWRNNVITAAFGFDAAAVPLAPDTFEGLKVERLKLYNYPHSDIDPQVFTSTETLQEVIFVGGNISADSLKKLKDFFICFRGHYITVRFEKG